MASVIIAKTKKDGSVVPSHEEGQHPPELMAAAEALLRAINEKSASAVASALTDAFAIAGSMPSDPMDD